MDWAGWVIGAIIGAVFGLLIQNIAFPSTSRRLAEWRRRRFFAEANRAWDAVERGHPNLFLVQAGWDRSGCFPPGSVIFRLDDTFELSDGRLARLRDDHTHQWTADDFKDAEQAGISSISITRVSDRPDDEQHGRSHHMRLMMHTYRYFDHLATHLLRLTGTDAEKAILNAAAGNVTPGAALDSFPNPCSVGLSVFCEDGTHLALTRRTTNPGAGGHSHAGKTYNAVGESVAPRDFAVALDGSLESSPDVVARRGLYEELGLTVNDIAMCAINIHSFAWSSDILDHKFFGMAITPLSRAEIQDRWRNAPDRSETIGNELAFRPVQTRSECLRLLETIKENSDEWAPEAAFSSIRSLLTLRRVAPADVTKILGGP